MSSLMNDTRGESVPHNTSINELSYELYKECVAKSELPIYFGVSNRVVDALVTRILADSSPSLGIGDIAHDLELSKRTLQRRLGMEDTKFSILRDQVRRHYAVLHLMRRDLSIASISECLDFSDRTGFTNAFKRWTNMSPRAFRTLYEFESLFSIFFNPS